jgi:hypothetical protein
LFSSVRFLVLPLLRRSLFLSRLSLLLGRLFWSRLPLLLFRRASRSPFLSRVFLLPRHNRMQLRLQLCLLPSSLPLCLVLFLLPLPFRRRP